MASSCKMEIKSLLLLAVLAISPPYSLEFSKPEVQQIILLLSFDGFRYDYLDKYNEKVPNLRDLARKGVHVEYIDNVYPTSTFPNHYSIVTGLYPESHGIIANEMYDPVFNSSFSMWTTDPIWWESAEPIWLTNQRQGHKSGVCLWPGYDIKIRGHLPTYWPKNTSFADSRNKLPLKDRVDMAIRWLNQTLPPTFVALWFQEPDEVGHAFGTDSKELGEVLGKLDEITNYLMKELRKLHSFDRINLIITSGHGMMNYNASTVVSVDKYVDPDSYRFWSPSAVGFLLTNSSKENLSSVYNDFKKAEQKTGIIKIYRKEETPDRFHYRHNRRIADIVGVAIPGYLMNTSKLKKLEVPKNHSGGEHGYDPVTPEMHPFLIAYGPVFKRGYLSGPVRLIDIYPLMCHIIGIKPLTSNGSLSRVRHLLRPQYDQHEKDSVLGAAEIFALLFASFVLTGFCICGLRVGYRRIDRRYRIKTRKRWPERDILLMENLSDREDTEHDGFIIL